MKHAIGPVLVPIGCMLLLAADAPRGPLEFVLHPAHGPDATGPVEHLQLGGRFELAGAHPAAVQSKDVVTLRRAGVPLPPRPRGAHLVLANGDQFPGDVRALAGETLRFRAACGEERELALPLSAVSLWWLAAPEGTGHPEVFRRRLAAGKRKHDAVYLRNGDLLEGVVNALNSTQLQMEIDQKEVSVDISKRVAVVAFSTELTRLPLPKTPYAVAVLANGARVSLAAATADGHELTGKTVLGAELRIPLAQLAALYIHHGRAVYLSDLKPTRYEYTPFFDDAWPYVRDGSVLERDLLLGGSTYDKGLGLHSACRLTYDLTGGYQSFEAVVGLDDATGREGSAGIQVLVDGKPRDLGLKEPLVGQGPPRPLRVDVRGARALTLVVAFGRGGHVQDHVDWADARLLR